MPTVSTCKLPVLLYSALSNFSLLSNGCDPQKTFHLLSRPIVWLFPCIKWVTFVGNFKTRLIDKVFGPVLYIFDSTTTASLIRWNHKDSTSPNFHSETPNKRHNHVLLRKISSQLWKSNLLLLIKMRSPRAMEKSVSYTSMRIDWTLVGKRLF